MAGKYIGISILSVISLLIFIIVGSYIAMNNQGTKFENQITQLQQDSQSSLSNLTMRIAEMAQIPTMATSQLKEIIEKQMTGRYGQDGSKAMFQFFKEQNLQVDSKLYTNVQSEIAGGRKDFEISQNRLISQCAPYKNQLGYIWSGFWLRLTGYPRIDLSKICRVISDDKTNSTFETSKQTIIKLQ